MSDLIPFTRSSRGHGATSIRSLVQDACQVLESTLLERKIAVEIDVPGTLFTPVDRIWFKSMIREMLELAIERSPEESEVHISAHQGPRGGLELEVADWGETTYQPVRSALAAKYQRLAQHAAMQSASFAVLRCPEGGMASALTLPSRWNEAAA